MPKRLTLTGKAFRQNELHFRKEKVKAKKQGDEITAGVMEAMENLNKYFKEKDILADASKPRKH